MENVQATGFDGGGGAGFRPPFLLLCTGYPKP